AVHRDRLRMELDVALVRRDAGPILAYSCTAVLRRVERHLAVRRALGEERRRALRIALLPRLAVAAEPRVRLRARELRVRARRDAGKNRDHCKRLDNVRRHACSSSVERALLGFGSASYSAPTRDELARRREQLVREAAQAVVDQPDPLVRRGVEILEVA